MCSDEMGLRDVLLELDLLEEFEEYERSEKYGKCSEFEKG